MALAYESARVDRVLPRSFSAGLFVNIGVFAYFGSILRGLTLYLQLGLGMSALRAGLTFAPLGVAFAATSILSRPLIARYGPRVASAGVVVAACALAGQLADIHVSGTVLLLDIGLLVPCFAASLLLPHRVRPPAAARQQELKAEAAIEVV